MITIGHEYELDVVKVVEFGFYLDAEDLGEILLPHKFAPPGLAVGDYLVVFLYRDCAAVHPPTRSISLQQDLGNGRNRRLI